MSKKVAVALSGGLDSSVTAFLLKKQGYNVVAITCKMLNDEKYEQIVEKAKAVANKIGIEHHVIDVTDIFNTEIINYFDTSYKNGYTPNPCILCNKKIKWGKLFDYAINELNCDLVASGHYANIVDENGIKKLYPAKDTKKDQQYYLFELTQNQLRKIVFPLSGFDKDEIRQIAMNNDLPAKSSKDSQDICFITKPNTTKKYLIEKFGEKKGDFILIRTNQKLGMHNGFYQYTIGQRKGIGIAYPEPLYVVKLDAEKNIVYVGTKNDLLATNVFIENINLQYPIDKKEFNALIKIRYNMNFVSGKVSIKEDTATINFNEPISAITPGQAVVFYDEKTKYLIGGGWIKY